MRVVMDHPLFLKAKPVILQIESHGYEAYFVGGCVRDLILNRPIHDIDIASSAFPEEIQTIFPKTFDVGIEHGTVVVIFQSEQYEITTFRTEAKYSDFRRPDQVNFVRNLQEDTLRRDFTINALALDTQGQLYDYHGGLEDLESRIIRCVGNPIQRFTEDALRMMRAIRFASQLNFSIESDSFQAIIQLSENLKHIAIERCRIEFMKFLTGDYFLEHYQLIYQSHLSDYLPGFEDHDNFTQVMHLLAEDLNQISHTHLVKNHQLIWARLVNYLQLNKDQQRKFLRQWTHSNDFIDQVIEVQEIINRVLRGSINRFFIYQCQMDNIILASEYLESKNIENNIFQEKLSIPIQSKKDLKINGKDIIDFLNLKHGGPIIGKILDEIENHVVHGQLENQRSILIQYLNNELK